MQPMPARQRVVLQGFSEFERNALNFCLKLTADRQPAYEPLPTSSTETDFIVADADMHGVIDAVVKTGRAGITVFVGRDAPPGALSHVTRPIDPTLIVRELDRLAHAKNGTTPDDEKPSIDLPDTLRMRATPTPFVGWKAPTDIDGDTVPSRLERLGEIPLPEVTIEVDTAWPPLPTDGLATGPAGAAPATVEEPAVDERAVAKAAARAAARRARIAQAGPSGAAEQTADALVLDDSEIAQVYLSRVLSEFGFKPHVAESSGEALEMLAQQRFSVAFFDVQLAEGDDADGIDLCQWVKHTPPAPQGSVPAVVVVSGQSRPSDRVRAGLAGCDVFLTKPIRRGDVARALETCGVALPKDQRKQPR